MSVSQLTKAPQVRCRQIRIADLEAVADLLARGFPARPRKYWTTALERLTQRSAPEGCPTYGYLLEADGVIVGVLLLIFSGSGDAVRCNISSWYVEPQHRGHAAILASMASKLKHVTYLNVSAAAHTRPILEAQGYRRYSEGQFLALPALKRGHVRARRLDETDAGLADYELLQAHANAGCDVLVCDGEPFVFLRRRVKGSPLPLAQLVYARDTDRFVAHAGSLGRFLLGRGVPAVLCDAQGPLHGVPGVFFKDRVPRYYKGPNRPALNDLSFTEMVVFGP